MSNIQALRQVQSIPDQVLDTVTRRVEQAREGRIVSMLVISRDNEGNLVMDRSMARDERDRMLGQIETLKHELLTATFEEMRDGYDEPV